VPEAKSTQVQGINNRGQIVGKYSNTSNAVSENGSLIRGFLLDRGRYVRLDFPGAVTSQAFDINDRGQVVGEYQDADGRFHGHLWQRGRFRTIDVPSQPGTTTAIGRLLRLAVAGAVVTALTAAAAAAAPPTRTGDAASMGVQADGLSRLGAGDSGSGTGPRSPFPAFLLDRGRYTAFGAPRPGVELYPLGINDRGQIVGNYQNPNATPSRQRTGAPPPRGIEETPS
jgi:probable HAF family extracellular repeat protein